MSNISTISTIHRNIISTIHTSTIHTSTIHTSTIRLSTPTITKVTPVNTKTTMFSTINVASLTSSQLQTMQQNAKNDHQKIGTILNDFSSVFNNYNSTTDPTEKAAWGVIAQKRLNDFQSIYSVNSIDTYISTVTHSVPNISTIAYI